MRHSRRNVSPTSIFVDGPGLSFFSPFGLCCRLAFTNGGMLSKEIRDHSGILPGECASALCENEKPAWHTFQSLHDTVLGRPSPTNPDRRLRAPSLRCDFFIRAIRSCALTYVKSRND